jgi:GNAT superfamily N-acetyltransferase
MEGPRAPVLEEFPELVSFLDQNLRDQNAASWSIADEYPTTVNPQNIKNFRIIKDEEKILSHALFKPIMCKTRRGLFKVGAVGSVVTHDDYRNQGLSQNIIKDCLEALTAQNCDIAILWTNLYDFYRKMGFELAGSEISLLIEKPLLIPESNLKIMQNNRVDPQALYRLYNQHSVCSIRTLEDFEKFLKIPNSRLYTAWTPDGKMDAYAVEGKGADLQGYVHEWGGSVDGIAALANHIFMTTQKPITVISPSHSQNLIRKLQSLGVKRVDGFLGMIKITNTQNFFAKIVKNAKQEWGIGNFVLEKRGETYFYGLGDNLFKTDQESDIIRLLFGPQKPSRLHDCGPQMNAVLDKIFPLEMWIWGFDSI